MKSSFRNSSPDRHTLPVKDLIRSNWYHPGLEILPKNFLKKKMLLTSFFQDFYCRIYCIPVHPQMRS
jgi:hypothetical protein